ncbi:hypothetical protein CEE45_05795 [Candidatus Heimdallarchaeota archaeon B3_Heim]|nr:MAG: hypothetical protein CEE45_05795 [Candidatus Heimdallarchaeota archaeon B3_Heim]
MTLKIEMDDLFYGIIRNYGQFGIRSDTKYNTKWTPMILGYFANLGQMLGCYVEYEWKYFDLTWF